MSQKGSAILSEDVKFTQGNSPPGLEFTTLRRRRYNGDVSKYTKVVNKVVGTIREEWCDRVLADQGFSLGEEYSRSEYQPEQLFDAFKNYDGPSKFNIRGDERAAFTRAVSKVESHFAVFYGSLQPLKLDSDLWDVVKKETSSGLPSLMPKRLVFDQSIDRATRLLERERLFLDGADLSARKDLPPPEPCVAFYRTQASIKDGKPKKKTRFVWGFPLEMILIEALYARPIIDCLLTAVTPISLGYRKSELGAMMASTAWWPVTGTFDWSKWDSNVPTQLVSESFRIARKFFREVDESAWHLITSYFATCGVVMPDSFLYTRRRKGIPSGSFFTSIIGSIANMIAIHFLAYLQGLNVIGIHVYGDDSRVGFTGNIDVKRLEQDGSRCFGMKLNLEKLSYGGPNVSPRYLGHDWYRGRIRRPVVETAQRIIYPERYNPEWYEDRYSKLISLYGDNVDAWPLILKILKEKGLALRFGSGEQFLLGQFRDTAGFTETESPELRGQRKRFAAATFK